MTTILRGIVGSTAYGLAHEGSDIDRLGMYVADTEDFHGLHIPTGKQASRVQTEPSDFTEHEAGKYLSLLLRSNPTVTELLWLPEELYEIATNEARELIAIRDQLVNAKSVRDAYLGYATQQFRRLSERGDGSFSSDTRKRTEKHARHLRRLCWQGFILYSTGDLPIKIEDPDSYFDFGELVAQDPGIAGALISKYEFLFDNTKSVLPSNPNEEVAEQWLKRLRKQFMTS